MARWTGDPEIGSVLEGADTWRASCFVGTGSMFTDQNLWTAALLDDVLTRFKAKEIEGSSRDFVEKFSEQLQGAPAETVHLAAEVLWFLLLFPSPSAMKAETKRRAIETVWSWTGEAVPSSKFLDDAHLHGVGNPGTAYLTLRPAEFEYILRTVLAFKKLPEEKRELLTRRGSAWEFGQWLDQQEGSDRRLARNVFLYFLFPDDFERILSRDHKAQIYEALKGKLPRDRTLRGRSRSLLEYDHALYDIRQVLEAEKKSADIDFYRGDIRNQWYSVYREGSRKNFASWLDTYLKDRGLRLNQSGRDTTIDKLREEDSISTETGFWSDDSGLTAKPPRWLIHFDLTTSDLTASVPDERRSRVVGFANTKGGDSGALGVRILPVAKTANGVFQVIETWEWLLLFCFPGGLKPGSAAQAFDDFDPTTGVLTYMEEDIPYVFAGLLCLNSPEEAFSANVGSSVRNITYREATECLARLIHVAEGGAHG